MDILGTLLKLWNESGFAAFFMDGGWKNLVMIIIAFVLLYLGIVKKFEPLLLCGIAFGCLLSNLSYFVAVGGTNAMYHPELWADFLNEASPYYHSYGHILANAGLLDVFYIGVKAGIYPSLIFMGVGAMTDFGPMIANPKSMLMGASAQLGVFVAFFGAVMLGFTGPQSASIGIIGGADGPTAIYLTGKLAPHLLGPIAVAAYSYMALVPVIQPAAALYGAADRLPDAGQPVPGVRRDGSSVRYRTERADEHHHHLPLHLRGRDHERREFPEPGYHQDHSAGPGSLRHLHRWRAAGRRCHVLRLRKEDQSADRLCRRLRRTHGSPGLSGCGPQV